MKKTIKKFLSATLAFVMLFGSVPLSGFVGLDFGNLFRVNASAADHSVGDLIEFGSYPQSRVTDSATLSALNSLSKTWVSYGYYSGTDKSSTMVPGDWMKYADVTYHGAKYRAVTFTQYRPYYVCDLSTTSDSYQDNNGYNVNTTYWFKYEPLEWRVLDPANGLVLCETIIDSQAYSNTIYGSNPYYNNSSKTVYANDYATSSIRAWLNADFYNTAFTASEKAYIQTIALNNDAYSSSYSQYDSAPTNDKVFLLSYGDALNSAYGFSNDYVDYDVASFAKGSDYAKCQGLYVYSSLGSSYNGNSYWWLRTPGSSSACACHVNSGGNVYYLYSVSSTYIGVRPALKLNLQSSIFESEDIVSPTGTVVTISDKEQFVNVGDTVLSGVDGGSAGLFTALCTSTTITDANVKNTDFVWTSGDESILKVTGSSFSKFASGVESKFALTVNVLGVKAGTTTLTVTTSDGARSMCKVTVVSPNSLHYTAKHDTKYYYENGGFYSAISSISDTIEIYTRFENAIPSEVDYDISAIKPIKMTAVVSGSDLSFEKNSYKNSYTMTTKAIQPGKAVDDILLLYPYSFNGNGGSYTVTVKLESESFAPVTETYAFTIEPLKTKVIDNQLNFINNNIDYSVSKKNIYGESMATLKNDAEYKWSKYSTLDFNNYYEIVFADILASLLNAEQLEVPSLIPEFIKEWVGNYKTILKGVTTIVDDDYSGVLEINDTNLDKLFKISKYSNEGIYHDDELYQTVMDICGNVSNTQKITKLFAAVDKTNQAVGFVKLGVNVIKDALDWGNRLSLYNCFTDADEDFKAVVNSIYRNIPASETKMRDAVYDYMNYSSGDSGRVKEILESFGTLFKDVSLDTFNSVVGKKFVEYIGIQMFNWVGSITLSSGAALSTTAAFGGIKTAFGAFFTGASLGLCLSDILCDSSGKAKEMGKTVAMSEFSPYIIKTLSTYEANFKSNKTLGSLDKFEYAFAFHKATQSYIMEHTKRALEAKRDSIINKLFGKSDDYNELIKDILAQKAVIDNLECPSSVVSNETIETKVKIIEIRCPVDVVVYDETGNEVIRIINDSVEYVADEIDFFVDNGEKYIVVPADKEYTIKITATDNGKMAYSVSEYSSINGKSFEIGNSNISLTDNQEFTGKIDKLNTSNEDSYSLISQNNNIDISAANIVESVSVKTLPNKTEYLVGDTVDTAGLVVSVKYSDKTVKEITDGFLCTKLSADTLGKHTVELYYLGKTCTFDVNVTGTPVSGIAINESSCNIAINSTKLLTATVAPNNATNKNVIWTSSNTSVATVNASGLVTAKAAGTATITATTVEGTKTASCTVTVKENRVEKIEILTQPNTVGYTYKIGSFDKTGLSIRATYSNGDTETITDTSKINVTGFNSSQKGNQNLTVEYDGKQAEQKINVTVKYAWWQWIIKIVLFGWIWY